MGRRRGQSGEQVRTSGVHHPRVVRRLLASTLRHGERQGRGRADDAFVVNGRVGVELLSIRFAPTAHSGAEWSGMGSASGATSPPLCGTPPLCGAPPHRPTRVERGAAPPQASTAPALLLLGVGASAGSAALSPLSACGAPGRGEHRTRTRVLNRRGAERRTPAQAGCRARRHYHGAAGAACRASRCRVTGFATTVSPRWARV